MGLRQEFWETGAPCIRGGQGEGRPREGVRVPREGVMVLEGLSRVVPVRVILVVREVQSPAGGTRALDK